MAAISKLVRDAASARLAAAWATKLTAIAPAYTGVKATDVASLNGIDWTGVKKQFFQGQLNVDELEATTAIGANTYPLVIMFASDAVADGIEKFITFSGSVDLHLEFHYTWRKVGALPNFDEFLDLIEETAIAVFHDKNWLGALPAGMTYGCQVSVQRGPVLVWGENWAQAISFRFKFGVDV